MELASSEAKLFEAILAWKRKHLPAIPEPETPSWEAPGVSCIRSQQTHLPKQDRAAVAQLYRDGRPVQEIAAQFGIHRKSVREIAKTAGLPAQPRGLQEQDLPRAAMLYRSGWSLARVGEEFGVNASTVMNVLKREGVEMRPRRGGRAARGS